MAGTEIDTRGSHFYMALYWARALAEQTDDGELSKVFEPVFESLSRHESVINEELIGAQGSPVDIGGYYHPNDELANMAMRPSNTLNTTIDALSAGLALT